jgi:hypothetical protein
MKRGKSRPRPTSRPTPGHEIDDILEATQEPRRRTSAVTRSAIAASGEADDLINRIVKELQRNGPLNDPRALAGRSILLPDYLRSEVRRTINNLLQPLGLVPPLTADTARQLAELHLRRGEKTKAMMYAHHAQRGVPDGGDRLKLRCAEEAYHLMEWFSPPDLKPTLGADGPYFMITGLLYEAATGIPTDDLDTAMKRSCTRWLKYRKKFPCNTPASKLPPPTRS